MVVTTCRRPALSLLRATAGLVVVAAGLTTIHAVGEYVPVTVSRLRSPRLLAEHDYYDINFCQPQTLDDPAPRHPVLRWLLGSETFFATPYALILLKNETCKLLCISPGFAHQGDSSQLFIKLVKVGSYAKLRVRGQPVVLASSPDAIAPTDSYPIGHYDADEFFVTNHITFHIKVQVSSRQRQAGSVSYSIIDAHAEAASRRIQPSDIQLCELPQLPPQKASGDIVFTYSVYWLAEAEPATELRSSAVFGGRELGNRTKFFLLFVIMVLVLLAAFRAGMIKADSVFQRKSM
eukprot:SM000191S05221  [mRNA]  locus=s191:166101:167354:+ [translate_table: standard]